MKSSRARHPTMADHNSTFSDVAILIVSYNGMGFLADCLASIHECGELPPPGQIVVVDNASTDGSADFVEQNYPEVTCIRLASNTGFVGGNNAGFAHIRQQMPNVRYVALLNQDTIVRPGWLAALREAVQPEDVGCAQAKLLFHPETDLINSAGNRSHYLGFGFVSAYRQKDDGRFDAPGDIAFCSGAAMVVKVSAIARDDLFDPAYFAYLEDAELGWYMRLRGLRNVYCPASLVCHRYQFRRNAMMYYRLEQNRWRLLLTYYRWPTLLLILPALLMMEGGLLFYFLGVRAMKQKLRSWSVLGEFASIMRKRRAAQRQRTVGDRQLTGIFIGKADFPEVSNPLLNYVGNPLLSLYWRIARLLLWW